MPLERVQRSLARAGFGSRRACEELIVQGRVTIDGTVATLGDKVDPETAVVAVDRITVNLDPNVRYYALHKPVGVVTTMHDPQGRPDMRTLMPADGPRVFPVGRLDRDSEGLLLLTNDGELTNRLTHPRYGIEKEYLAEVEGIVSAGSVRKLRDGIELDDGVTAPAKVSQPDQGVLRIAIHEGRNRQVRRMCEAIGHPVRRLVRVRIGPLTDRRLQPGAWRELTGDELRSLEQAVAPEAGRTGGRYDRET
jgi:23S rRNA pseudouridine2605 synthase